MFHLIIPITFGLLSLVDGHSNGVPIKICKSGSVIPKHYQNGIVNEPQPLDIMPYKVITSSSTYSPGKTITFKITSHFDQTPFKGFFLQVRDLLSHELIGEFKPTETSQPVTECNGVSHKEPSDKYYVALQWNPPQDAKGSFYIVGSIVQSFSTFWKIPVPLLAH